VASEKGLGRTLYGVHPVEEALRTGRQIDALFLAEGAHGPRLRGIEELARARGIKLKRVDAHTVERMAGSGVHQGVVAQVAPRRTRDLEEILTATAGGPALIVVLDGVQDPHNLGAVVRNAALTGVAAVLIPKDRAASVTPVVEKVAAGGLEHVDVVRVGNIAQTLVRLKEAGFWIYGAAGDAGAEDLDRVAFDPRTVVVLGDEHEGLRRLARERCDTLVRIPSTGKIDSYNLATASGIILARLYSERRHGS
jgi:23S rRNA (guanosine2251-2'-O)-methyltransferase